MAKTSSRQKRIAGRVMHEFKHGESKSGRSGKAGKVKSRRRAIAIAMQEAGASRYENDRRNRRNLQRIEARKLRGAGATGTRGQGACRRSRKTGEHQDHGRMGCA